MRCIIFEPPKVILFEADMNAVIIDAGDWRVRYDTIHDFAVLVFNLGTFVEEIVIEGDEVNKILSLIQQILLNAEVVKCD